MNVYQIYTSYTGNDQNSFDVYKCVHVGLVRLNIAILELYRELYIQIWNNPQPPSLASNINP